MQCMRRKARDRPLAVIELVTNEDSSHLIVHLTFSPFQVAPFSTYVLYLLYNIIDISIIAHTSRSRVPRLANHVPNCRSPSNFYSCVQGSSAITLCTVMYLCKFG